VAWSLQLGCKLPKGTRIPNVTHWIRRNFDSHESWFGIRTHHKAGVTETPPESSPDSVGTQEDTASVTFGDERYEREPLVPKATGRLSKESSALIK
jgi:hypothetical protein